MKRLEKAVSRFTAADDSRSVAVVWAPFMIDPATNPNGEEFEAYNRRRWGGSGWTNHLKGEGRKDGANFANWKTWPNTFHGHQLVRFAEEKGVSTSKSNKALFEAIYEEGENISDIDVLVRIGERELSLDPEEIRLYLESGEGGPGVKNDISTGRKKYSISGVPFFVIGAEGKEGPPYALSGAQSSNTLMRVFESVTEEDDE